jgi:hypothetical protein
MEGPSLVLSPKMDLSTFLTADPMFRDDLNDRNMLSNPDIMDGETATWSFEFLPSCGIS